ncbi:MAG: CPBP family intramembrane glutamic endopeptidase [Gemmatimonadaceae bacterium]
MRLTPLPSTRRIYWHDTRAPRYSLTIALPLFVVYELLAAALSGAAGGVRNGADVMLKSPFIAAFGPWGPLVFVGLLAIVFAVLVSRDIKAHGRPQLATFVIMFVESLALAVVFGVVVGMITPQLLGPLHRLSLAPQQLSLPTGIMVSLGAGLYEELLFRVILVGALLWGSKKLLGWGPVASGMLAIVGGALIFSAFHYVGSFGDPFTVSSFTFRAVAGLAFSALYVCRGFGITAWTHALYDVMLMVVRDGA